MQDEESSLYSIEELDDERSLKEDQSQSDPPQEEIKQPDDFNIENFFQFYKNNRITALQQLNQKFKNGIFTYSDEENESEYEEEIIEHNLFPRTTFVFDPQDQDKYNDFVRVEYKMTKKPKQEISAIR